MAKLTTFIGQIKKGEEKMEKKRRKAFSITSGIIGSVLGALLVVIGFGLILTPLFLPVDITPYVGDMLGTGATGGLNKIALLGTGSWLTIAGCISIALGMIAWIEGRVVSTRRANASLVVFGLIDILILGAMITACVVWFSWAWIGATIAYAIFGVTFKFLGVYKTPKAARPIKSIVRTTPSGKIKAGRK